MRSLGRVAITAVAAQVVVASGEAKKPAKPSEPSWAATRTVDPITGDSTCVVAAYDRVLGRSYSRAGYLYPIVENNSKFGLLVGVSSGGRIRVPTGNIVWRNDDRPHRELKAAENPGLARNTFAVPATGNSETDKKVSESMANTSAMVAAMTATSTVASGEKAQEMLAEMLRGRGLIYRAAAVAPAYGLPSDGAYRVGQWTKDGLKPIPIDDSFHKSLAACGIPLPPGRSSTPNR